MTADTTAYCPTFVDLGAEFEAASESLAQGLADTEGHNPFGADARLVPVHAGDCEVFVTMLPAGAGRHSEDRGDTWIFALQGGFRLLADGKEIVLAQGESLVVSRGTRFDWHADASASLVGMRYLNAAKDGRGIVAIDSAAPLLPSNPPADDVLLGARPSCRSGNQFASADGVFKCGIWDSTPYRRLPIHFHHSELMHLLAGSVTFTDASGRTATFRRGDTFIIEKGADCSWDSGEYVAKIYAYYRP